MTWKGLGHEQGDVLLSQRRVRKPALGLWRSERRNIWERERTPTPSSSSLFSSWASPSFSFASPWLPSAIGPHPRLFLSSSVSVPLFGWAQQFGGQIWGSLRIWSPTFGAQNQGCFQKWPKLVTPYTSVCALSENTTALSATIRLQPLSGRILLLFTTAAICTKEWTYEIVKYGRRTSCFVFSSFLHHHHRWHAAVEVKGIKVWRGLFFPFHKMLLAERAAT